MKTDESQIRELRKIDGWNEREILSVVAAPGTFEEAGITPSLNTTEEG